MHYQLLRLKNKIENILIFPFILIGRLLFLLHKKEPEYEIFFFFPFYHTGGAEKVHVQITQATGNPNCIIYFTRKSHDKNFYSHFVKSGCTIKDISKYTDSKLLYFATLTYRGYITGIINSQKSLPLIFNGQCNFGYKISPWIKKAIPQVELIHSFNTFSWIRIPFLPFIERTVMISKIRIEDHLKQYETLKVPTVYNSKIKYIVNGISLPAVIKEKDYTGNVKVLYVGRGTEEKRVHLIAKMAEQAAKRNLAVEFLFMGDVQAAIPERLQRYCKFLGHKSDETEIGKVYQQSHIIMITSYTEGFPMVIEEGMARGCAVMATPVGDIPVHVKNNETGFLFSTIKDEELIVTEAIDFLILLYKNKNMLKEMAGTNIDYAISNFSLEAFNKRYQQLFNDLRSK